MTTKPNGLDELNYQCSCGLCFFAKDVYLIEEHHKLTRHAIGRYKSVKSIVGTMIETYENLVKVNPNLMESLDD